jgi:hypothetical protein
MNMDGDLIQNFLFVLHQFRQYNKKVVFALANRIIDPDVSPLCSPKVACLALGSFTDVFSFSDDWDNLGNAAERQDLLSRI